MSIQNTSLKIGINPIGWNNDSMPELSCNAPLETCLLEAAKAGYSGIELGSKFPRDAKALRKSLARHNLQLISGWYSGNLVNHTVDEEWAIMQDHLQLLKSQHCTILVYAEALLESFFGTYRPRPRQPVFEGTLKMQRYCQRLTELGNRCLEQGIRLAVHQHLGSVFGGGEDIDHLIQYTGVSVGLLLDTGHCLSSGINPVEVARKHAPHICHVHCKDVRANVLKQAQKLDMGFIEAVQHGLFTVPGDGCIDYSEMLTILKEAGYQGWLVVDAEQNSVKAPPLTYAKLGYEHLTKTAHVCGFDVSKRNALTATFETV